MRDRVWLAAVPLALAVLAGGVAPSRAQTEDSQAKRRLDVVLAVLRGHQSAAGKACLDAMTEVHHTEDQVSDLGQQATNSNKTDNGADVARDVLESDYETADGACRPDAQRACGADPGNRDCVRLGGETP